MYPAFPQEFEADDLVVEARKCCDNHRYAKFTRDHATASMDPYLLNVVVQQTKRDMDAAVSLNRSQFKVIRCSE